LALASSISVVIVALTSLALTNCWLFSIIFF
jgi:hypothetical protein